MSKEIIFENHFWCGICSKKTISGTVICVKYWDNCVVSGLRQILVTESPLKIMKNALYLTLKALFVLKMFKFLS